LRPGDRHHPVFERLAEHFEHVLAELRQLVEGEDASMRQGDLTRSGPAPAADESGVSDRV
jgi:hypothetical protein